MSNFALLIAMLLIAFPILYVLGIVFYLSYLAKKNDVHFVHIFKHLLGQLKTINFVKIFVLSFIFAIVTYIVFVSSMDTTLPIKIFGLIDITLLLLTALWSISDNLLLDISEWKFFQQTNVNMLKNGSVGATNTEFDSNNDFSDTDMNTDPTYSFWHGNIYHDMYKDNHIKDWNNEIADNWNTYLCPKKGEPK